MAPPISSSPLPLPPNGHGEQLDRLSSVTTKFRSRSFLPRALRKRWLLLFGTTLILATILLLLALPVKSALGEEESGREPELGVLVTLGDAGVVVEETKDHVAAYEEWMDKLLGGTGAGKSDKDSLVTVASPSTTSSVIVAEEQLEEVVKPTTELGLEADGVYDLGTLDIQEYQASLEEFIRANFPAPDSNETDPHSLLNDMRAFFRPTPGRIVPSIPERLFQTAPSLDVYIETAGGSRDSFHENNVGLNITFHDNDTADEWVKERFNMSLENGGENGTRGILGTWEALRDPPVLRSDFWR